MRKSQVMIAAVAVILAVLTSGCGRGSEGVGQSQAEVQLQETGGTESGKMEDGDSGNAKPQTGVSPKEEAGFPAGRMEDDYILPEVGKHVYTAAELSGLSKEELRIARNEIYARHGRMFKSDDLNQYFSGKSWYHATTAPDRFDMAVLNQNEKDNLKVIQHGEEGKTVCAIPKIGTEEFPKVDGSTATLPLTQAMYRMSTGASAKEAESAVVHGKTTRAWEGLLSAEGPKLVIAYEPGENVEKAIRESGVQIVRKPIGRDALVFLANKSNPVHSLTEKQIVDIYMGKVKNWKDVGGKDRPIQAFQRPEDSGSQNIMNKLVMKGKKMADAPRDYIVNEMGDLIDQVSAYDNTGDALGYSVYYYARNMYRKPGLAFMEVDEVAPASETIRDKSYPYVNDFYAAIRADEPKDSKAYQLFDWLTGEDGQSMINGLGYVGVKDSAKQLPQGLLETGEDKALTGTIPLPPGNVILADGSYLYGEEGTAVFDSGMNLLRFISHVDNEYWDRFTECSRDEVIPAQDTVTGKGGYYSISDDRWVNPTDDGNNDLMDSWFGWDGTWDEWTAAQGKTWTDWLAEQGESEEELRDQYEGISIIFSFGHPNILKQYGATLGQVETLFYGESLPPIVRIREGTVEHYYDVEGNHLLDDDTQKRPDGEDSFLRVFSMDRHTAYSLWYPGNSSDKAEYRVYRDGIPFKTLTDNQDGEIMDISQHFYTRSRGNYLYFYNYQDEPCAKFLEGYYTED